MASQKFLSSLAASTLLFASVFARGGGGRGGGGGGGGSSSSGGGGSSGATTISYSTTECYTSGLNPAYASGNSSNQDNNGTVLPNGLQKWILDDAKNAASK